MCNCTQLPTKLHTNVQLYIAHYGAIAHVNNQMRLRGGFVLLKFISTANHILFVQLHTILSIAHGKLNCKCAIAYSLMPLKIDTLT
jgi:hypothetical protein